MPLGLITISGTAGKVQIYYKLATVDKTVITGIGSVGIDDTATDVRYTQLSGDAVATSSVFTITNVPFSYYLINWTGLKNTGYKIVQVTVGTVTYTIPDISFPSASSNFLEAVNGLNIDIFKGTDFKITAPTSSIDETLVDYKFIFKAAGVTNVEFKVRNAENTTFIYLKGTSIAYPVVGYTPAPVCSDVFIS